VRVIAIDHFGARPTLRDIPSPEVSAGEIRLRMRAAGVNPMDWKVRDGAAEEFGQETVFPLTLGLEGAGVVDALGEGVTGFAVGDPVFGLFWPQIFQHGTFADFLVVASDARMSLKPEALTFETASVLPLAGGAALAAVRWLELRPGAKLLIIGATGGVGSYAVQIARAAGAHVIATATASDAGYIRDLGANEVIDFEAGDTVETARQLAPQGVDAVLDVIDGPEELKRVASLVREGGRLITTLDAADIDALAHQGVTAQNFLNHPLPEHFDELARLVVDGELRVHIEHSFPLEEAVTALDLSERGEVRGKVVLTM
jgi:NADPH:quinone reductase-like Zn-dependent oxidoreductase